MQFKSTFRLLGLLLIIFSFSMLTPILVSLCFRETVYFPFINAFIITFGTGGILYFLFRHDRQILKIRDGFLLVVLFWVVLCFFGAFPFYFSVVEIYSFLDALFESVSGFTTTGASVIEQLDALPRAVLFYRQQLQFLGGMGIVVLAVAILPTLGVGGLQLFKAESTGTLQNKKLTPRIAQTAKALWYIYFVLTILCVLAYHYAGMNWFDSIGESFATVSTGGFSMHNSSFAYYNNPNIQWIACIFMLLGGTSFLLHFMVYQQRSLKIYWGDEEFRCYFLALITVCVLVLLSLSINGYFSFNVNHREDILRALFNVISLATTTGYMSVSMESWPNYLPFIIILLGVMGGCAASTAGGVKVLRAIILYKQSKREMARLLHPNAVIPIKIGPHSLPESILQSMWGFISIFLALFILLMVLFMVAGNSFDMSFSLSLASLTNTGVSLTHMEFAYDSLNVGSKCLAMFAMLAGRLEIFSVLILLSRTFWVK